MPGRALTRKLVAGLLPAIVDMPVIVFDVNETLLDLSALDGAFEQVLGNPDVRQEWFRQMLQASMVTTLTGSYADFAVLGEAALEMAAERHEARLSASAKGQIFECLKQVPPYPDVESGLDTLHKAGFRLAVLTNSPPKTVEPQLAHAGLTGFFERILSVDAIRRYKPALEPYQMAARELGVEPADIYMVAAHYWDLAGARHAGCQTAYINRPGKAWFPLFEMPAVTAPDLETLADQLVAHYRR